MENHNFSAASGCRWQENAGGHLRPLAATRVAASGCHFQNQITRLLRAQWFFMGKSTISTGPWLLCRFLYVYQRVIMVWSHQLPSVLRYNIGKCHGTSWWCRPTADLDWSHEPFEHLKVPFGDWLVYPTRSCYYSELLIIRFATLKCWL